MALTLRDISADRDLTGYTLTQLHNVLPELPFDIRLEAERRMAVIVKQMRQPGARLAPLRNAYEGWRILRDGATEILMRKKG